jgi:hypothetical protein
MKYFVGVGAIVVIAVSYLFLFSGGPPATMPDSAVSAPDVASPAAERSATVAPEAIVLQEAAPVPRDEDAFLEEMAADTRESLPSPVTDTLTMTDALFLPRMRIMEYTYVTTAADARTSARDMRSLIEASAERLCLEGRQMFGRGVTLRNSFEDRNGTLFQRVYLLPEDCQKFY